MVRRDVVREEIMDDRKNPSFQVYIYFIKLIYYTLFMANTHKALEGIIDLRLQHFFRKKAGFGKVKPGEPGSEKRPFAPRH